MANATENNRERTPPHHTKEREREREKEREGATEIDVQFTLIGKTGIRITRRSTET